MESDKKLDTLEEEVKLMKGELKQSLASVRDYLLNMELPSSEFATVLAALGSDGDQKITMKGAFTNDDKPKEPDGTALEETEAGAGGLGEEGSEEASEEDSEAESELAPEEEMVNEEEPYDAESGLNPEDEMLGQEGYPESDEELLPEGATEETEESEAAGESLEAYQPGAEDELPAAHSELPLEEEPMECDSTRAESNQSTPKVNLLANLINWVARAKKEIGYEQLPTFLEVYGISGHLSPELKEAILNLAEITSEETDRAGTAATWSQAMLSLHGILTGGEAPLYLIKPSLSGSESAAETEEDEIIEVDKPREAPVKLKLVFPNGDGKSQEYCINLAQETNGNGA